MVQVGFLVALALAFLSAEEHFSGMLHHLMSIQLHHHYPMAHPLGVDLMTSCSHIGGLHVLAGRDYLVLGVGCHTLGIHQLRSNCSGSSGCSHSCPPNCCSPKTARSWHHWCARPTTPCSHPPNPCSHFPDEPPVVGQCDQVVQSPLAVVLQHLVEVQVLHRSLLVSGHNGKEDPELELAHSSG